MKTVHYRNVKKQTVTRLSVILILLFSLHPPSQNRLRWFWTRRRFLALRPFRASIPSGDVLVYWTTLSRNGSCTWSCQSPCGDVTGTPRRASGATRVVDSLTLGSSPSRFSREFSSRNSSISGSSWVLQEFECSRQASGTALFRWFWRLNRFYSRLRTSVFLVDGQLLEGLLGFQSPKPSIVLSNCPVHSDNHEQQEPEFRVFHVDKTLHSQQSLDIEIVWWRTTSTVLFCPSSATTHKSGRCSPWKGSFCWCPIPRFRLVCRFPILSSDPTRLSESGICKFRSMDHRRSRPLRSLSFSGRRHRRVLRRFAPFWFGTFPSVCWVFGDRTACKLRILLNWNKFAFEW